MVDCLRGCIGQYNKRGIKLPIDTNVLMPWVRVCFSNCTQPGSELISVGNFSSKQHGAVIKSFQFGHSNGAQVEIEIVDELGGQFTTYFNKIQKGLGEKNWVLNFQWGWAHKKCLGPAGMFDNQSCDPRVTPGAVGAPAAYTSCNHTLQIQLMKAKVERGMFKFTIQGTDIYKDLNASRIAKTQGSDKGPIPLKQAVTQLFDLVGCDVEFKRIDASGNEADFLWNVDGNMTAGDGPITVWDALNEDPLKIAYKWVMSNVSQDKKGCIAIWDTTAPLRPKFVFLESTKPFSGPPPDSHNCGTYIVNGGKCESGYTEILCETGWQRIDNVVKHKYSGLVACVDEDGNQTWKKISNWYRNKLDGRKLIKVHLHNSRQRFGSISGGIHTEDHPILTNEGYVHVGKLDITKHLIHSGMMCPSEEIHQAVIGTLLGDSSIRDKSYNYECTHCVKQLKYLLHKSSILDSPFKFKNSKAKSLSYSAIKTQTKTSHYWRRMRKLFYQNGKKVITTDILKDFTVISLAYLFMDDGHLNKKLSAEIATCCFAAEEVDLLIEKIKSLGIDCYRRPNGKYPRIYFRVDDTKKLSEVISPYVVPIMDYKLLPEHRNKQKSILNFGVRPFYDTFDLIRCELLERKTKTVYCIDVDQHHNFITHSGVVHNCSPVISFNPQYEWNLAQVQFNIGGVGGDAGTGKRVMNGQPPDMARTQGPFGNFVPAGGAAGGAGGGVGAVVGGSASSSVVPNAGIGQGIQISQYMSRAPFDLYMVDANVKANDYKLIHQTANNMANPIYADLRIQGDPSYSSPIFDASYFVSIVYIDPFFVGSNGPNLPGTTSCDWLIRSPACNEILSNSGWKIMGVFHEIKEGSYTTTLKLSLSIPGIDLARSFSLGGTQDGFNLGAAVGSAAGG